MTITFFEESSVDFGKTKYSRSGKVDKPINKVRNSSTREERRMSLPTEEHQDVEKRWLQKKSLWVIATILAFLFVTGLLVFTFVEFGRTPDVGGGLTIEADPGTKIYIGDKLVGTSQVSFTWGELFGDERHDALAKLPDHNPDFTTHDLVLGSGDKVLISGGFAIVATANVYASSIEYLIRRADGSLDQLFAYNLTWVPPNQPSGSYLLLIRLRKGTGASTAYFTSGSTGTSASSSPEYMRLFGKSPNTSTTISKFTAKSPPPEFAEEIQARGLWEPDGTK